MSLSLNSEDLEHRATENYLFYKLLISFIFINL